VGGPRRGIHEALCAGSTTRAAALRGAVRTVSLWLRGKRRRAQAGAHPRSQNYAHMVTRVQRRPGDRHRARPDAVIIPRSPTDGCAKACATGSCAAPQGAPLARHTSWHRVAEARARDLAGRRPAVSACAVRVDRAFFSEARNARARGGPTGDPRRRVRRAARGEHRERKIVHWSSIPWRGCAPRRMHICCRWAAISNDQQQLIERLGLRRFVRTRPACGREHLGARTAADVLCFLPCY